MKKKSKSNAGIDQVRLIIDNARVHPINQKTPTSRQGSKKKDYISLKLRWEDKDFSKKIFVVFLYFVFLVYSALTRLQFNHYFFKKLDYSLVMPFFKLD